MNEGATAPRPDSSAWDELVARAKVQGTVTQEEVCDVLDLDVERFDADLAWIPSELERLKIVLREDDLFDPVAAAEAEALAALAADGAHVASVLADPLGGIDVAADEDFEPRR